ncbi:beta-mannosidase [Flavobacterium sp.]
MKPFSILVCILLFPILIWAQTHERNLILEHWQFRKQGDSNWLQAKIPGTVHTDLFRNKIIADPFFAANEKQLQWIENEDWEYEATFTVSGTELKNQNCFLLFDGLDTYAEVLLNGKRILSADNMFRTWKVDVKKLLKAGDNKIGIVFNSAVKKGKEAAKKIPYTLPGEEKVFTRKAQYHYGWDWGPRFVTAGIWKPIKLIFWNHARIESVEYIQKELTTQVAKQVFNIKIEASDAGEYTIKFSDQPFVRRLNKGLNTVSIPIELKNPKLWWPHGLGVPHQYINDFSLYRSDTQLDWKRLKIGLRTIELVQKKDLDGRSFYFKVNGVPVFMKGANYIPPDSFLPRATDSVYRAIVKNAKDSNMNMLRVWGGGVYADDAFYDACDENGILVWQDFMFACAMYPGDDAFIENVKKEVIDNVNRLQNHPSIALWCGNNENDEGWHNWGWQKQYKYSEADSTTIWNNYKKLFHDVIPKTLDSLVSKDKNRYWPSSPSIGWGKKESLTQGDSHYWGVWWGKEAFEVYETKVGRFMSEYGFQGMPDFETIKAFAEAKDLNLQSKAVKNHQKHLTGYETITEYMARDYKLPKRFEDFIYVSQLLQAAGIKTAIEAHRRAKPYCMGTLFWQLNDCWPVTSWSSVDYFGRWKALNYQVKKSFSNLILSVKEEDNGYDIYLINDGLDAQAGQLEVEMIDFGGSKHWNTITKETISANESRKVFKIEKDFKQEDFRKLVLSVKFKFNGESVETLHYFVKPKELTLTKPNIQIKKINDLTYEISSDVLAKNVYLSSEPETFFSDNYFDVLPNQKIEIRLSKPVEKIETKSLFDTIN